MPFKEKQCNVYGLIYNIGMKVRILSHVLTGE